MRDLAFHQEVLDFLERDPRIDVVGAVAQAEGLFRSERSANPDVLVACPMLTRDLRHPAGSGRVRHLLVVGEEMTVTLLRDAIDSGARGVFAWPEERAELAGTIAAARAVDTEPATARGRVIAVFGPRGGAGTTFVASHLAAAFADEGRRCVLVDLDDSFADVSVALGIEPGHDARTVADLIPVSDELTPEHVEAALFRHPRGFAALLAPPQPTSPPTAGAAVYCAAVALLATTHDMVVLHTPRSMDDVARAGLSMADEVLLVVSPDLFSLYSARRAQEALGIRDDPNRCRVVVNPMVRGDVGLAEIERVLGLKPEVAIRFDPAVGRAQDRGEMVRARARRTWRDIRGLARRSARPTDPVSPSDPQGA